MVKRELRVGELVEDYCPRERRLSDHAIVAMVDDDVRQVRCTACDGEHEYRGGKLPPTRKKKPALAAPPLPPAGAVAAQPRPEPDAAPAVPAPAAVSAPAETAPPPQSQPQPDPEPAYAADGSVHRRLIRAQLPRIEGQVPERKIPEFTMHNNGGRGPGGQGRSFRGGHGSPGGHGNLGGPNRAGGGRPGGGHGRPGGGGFSSAGGRQGQGGQPGGGPNRSSRHGFGGRPGRGKKPQ